jgi:hypothetical protein
MNTKSFLIFLFMVMLVLFFGSHSIDSVIYGKEHGQQPQESEQKITKEEVINNYLKALGGEENIKKINSRTIKYKVFRLKMGGYDMESVVKRTGYLKIARPGAPQYSLFENGKAWRVSGEQKRELKGPVVENFRKMADIDGPFIDYEKKGITVTYKGMVPMEFSQLSHLEVLYKDGSKRDYYFDNDTGLIYMVKQPSFRMINNKISRGPTTIHYYYDYREVEGVKFPFSWIQTDEKLEHMHLFKVESIKLQ